MIIANVRSQIMLFGLSLCLFVHEGTGDKFWGCHCGEQNACSDLQAPNPESSSYVAALPSQAGVNFLANKNLFFFGTPANDNKLFISFKRGTDQALRFAIRYDQNVMVANSKINGIWGTERRSDGGGYFPPKGKQFSIIMTWTATDVKVHVNLHEQFVWQHRIPSGQINKLEVGGAYLAGIVCLDE